MEPLGMYSQTYLYKRPGFKNSYLRMPVPLDLQHLYDGRVEIKRSLKTADPRDAKRQRSLYSGDLHPLAARGAGRGRGQSLKLRPPVRGLHER
jgi:hypothetical protein